eukprot:gene472-379_t
MPLDLLYHSYHEHHHDNNLHHHGHAASSHHDPTVFKTIKKPTRLTGESEDHWYTRQMNYHESTLQDWVHKKIKSSTNLEKGVRRLRFFFFGEDKPPTFALHQPLSKEGLE